VTITVEENNNAPPVITSTPPVSGTVGQDILYDADATDSDGDVLSYSLTSSPEGASQDTTTGLISWVPDIEFSAGLQGINSNCTRPSTVDDSIQKVQTVTFIDTSGSMKEEQIFLSAWLSQLNGEMLGAGVGSTQSIDYGLTVFGSFYQFLPLVDGELLSDLTAITNTLIPANELPSMGASEDAIYPMLAAIDGDPNNLLINPYPFEENSSKSFIMFSDEHCEGCRGQQVTDQFKQRIVEEKIVLHSVVGVTLRCLDGTTALGFDANGTGYVSDGLGSYYKCESMSDPVVSANTLYNYIEPALLSGGSVWNIGEVESDDMTRRSLAKAMAEVISDITVQQVSENLAADLYIHSSSLQITDTEIQFNLGNRGQIASDEFEVTLKDNQGVFATQNIQSLSAEEMVLLSFDITGRNQQEIQIEITPANHSNECLTDNNALKLAAFELVVNDGRGGEDSQSFVLNVSEQNIAPVIEPIANLQALAGQPFTLNIHATDANKGDDLSFRLIQGTNLADLDQKNGVFQWTPAPSMIGTTKTFVVEVTDLTGLTDSQSFDIEVVEGVDPLKITSEAPKLAVIETVYLYQLVVESDSAANVTYELLAQPDGMVISNSGEVSWLAPVEELNKAYTVVIRVADQFGNVEIQSYRLLVDEAAQAPVITSVFTDSAELINGYGHFSTYTDINALETFTTEFMSAPAGLQFNSADFPYDNFDYDLTVRHIWNSPSTEVPESKSYANHWCGIENGVNLAPRISESVVVSPNQSFNDTHQTNILVSSIFDSNQDQVLNSEDDSYLIFNRNYGIAAIDARTLKELWFQPDVRAAVGKYAHSLAIADLDHDNVKEVLVLDFQGYLHALDSRTGEVVWKATDALNYWSFTQAMVYTDDLDADGNLEILAGTNIYNPDGTLRFSFGASNYIPAGQGPTWIESADINHDGLKELIYRDTVYSHTGVALYDGLGDGNYYTAANFDSDPELEWVQVNIADNTLGLFDHDASLLWSVELNRVSYPSVADVNLDGQLDIVMNYAMIEANGTIIRNEVSTRPADSKLTDLNHDGAFELITNDQGYIVVKSPITGDEIFKLENGGNTYDVTLTDRFGNGEYQIATPTFIRSNGHFGFKFISSADGQWTGGLAETTSGRYNSSSLGTANLWLDHMVVNHINPDLHMGAAQLRKVTGGYQLYAELRNLTPSVHSGDIQVDFYTDGVNGLVLIGSNIVSGIGPNQVIRVNHSQLIDPDSFDQSTFVVEATPLSPVTECRTDNNRASSEFVYWQVTDSTGLYDRQAYSASLKKPDIQPFSLEALQPATAWQPYSAQLTLRNYDDEDQVFFFSQDILQGMHISSTGLITWTPIEEQSGSNTIQLYIQDDGGLGRTLNINIQVLPSGNQAPYITSLAESTVNVNEEYKYQVIAIEPDGDPMGYYLDQAPQGATINNNGLVRWVPQVVTHTDELFTVKVSDPQGGFTIQNFNVRAIDANNSAPVIDSLPVTGVLNNQPYSYQVMATDYENDTIHYSLLEAPFGVSLDSQSGLLEWTPSTIGSYTISIKAKDNKGAWSYQKFNLAVIEDVNTAPTITSTPTTSHSIQFEDYSYQVVANDADGDVLGYRLIQAPIGIVIDSTNGLLNWPAGKQISGIFNIIIEVSDGHGGIATQSYDLIMGDGNSVPVITSVPELDAFVNRLYQYQLVVEDLDTPVLNYQLLSAPSGMLIDHQGLISWVPQAVGSYPVLVQVFDGTSFDRQGWYISVTETNANLDGVIQLAPISVLVDENLSLDIDVLNANGAVTVTATVDGTPISLDGNYQATLSSSVLGTHIVDVTITDSVETIALQSAFVVSDSADTNAPVIDILSPEDGNTASGFVDVQIKVEDDNLQSWQLSYRRGLADPSQDINGLPRTILAQGTDNVIDAVVSEFDTSLLKNGVYVLILEAVDIYGQASSVSHSFFLEGDLKLGHFSIAFEDLNIPVAGIPVSISRSYDTRDRNEDRDFGKGWSIGHQALELTENRVPGQGWYMVTEFYNYGPVRLPRYCIEPIGQRLVSVRMPDGKLDKFKIKAQTLNPSSDGRIECQDITPPDAFSMVFEPQGDTTSTLRAEGDAANYRIRNGNVEPLAGLGIYDPNIYTLTLQDGTIYNIEQGFNLTGIETTTGHSLEFTHDGIVHANGFAVSYIRDAQDRIIAIEKPNGQRLEYSYDADGNLASFTDLLGNTTTFSYIADHYLEEIHDPRGIRVARNEYDADGRLIAHIDAQGNRIEYTHDITGRTETVKDRNGYSSTFVYDNAGNVIAQTNAEGETTYHEYNEYRLETKRIDPLGNETSWTYDQQGNQLTETDALGRTTTSTYNRKGELLTQTDAQGNVVIDNEYNADYDPQTPSFPQHGYGQLKRVSDAIGNTTEFHWLSGITSPSPSGRSVTVSTGFTDSLGHRHEIEPISSGGSNDGLSGASIDLNGLRTETTYDSEARPLTETQIITDEFGVEIDRFTTSYVYNTNGDVIQTTDALGNITRTEYNELGKVSATVDAHGNRTEMEYDARGNQVLTRYADLTTETKTFDAEGKEIASTDRAGRTTSTEYDKAGRVVKVTSPDGSFTSNDYDAAGRLIAVTDSLGNTTSYVYDAAGQRIKTIDSLGNETTFVYDNLGRRIQSRDAKGNVTQFEYNSLGSLTKTIFANGTFTTTVYDELSRKVSETDLAGRTTYYEYSDSGNLTAVVDPKGQITQYEYDQRGNKIAQIDALGRRTSWTYDALGRVSSRTLPEGQTETYSYDANGNQIAKTDFNSDTTVYEFNNMNELVRTNHADGRVVVNTYTDSGQPDTITDDHGVTSYSYDIMNRLVRLDYPDGRFVAYAYDSNNNKIRLETQNQIVANTYDALVSAKPSPSLTRFCFGIPILAGYSGL
jgi:YD repeat-containing protein